LSLIILYDSFPEVSRVSTENFQGIFELSHRKRVKAFMWKPLKPPGSYHIITYRGTIFGTKPPPGRFWRNNIENGDG